MVEYLYDTWGKVLSVSGTLATTLGYDQPFLYRGYVYDKEYGLYYLQSRYYDPTTCRFISADVLLSTGQGVLGHNSFAYCLNKPVNGQDPDGHIYRPYSVMVLDNGGGHDDSYYYPYRDVTSEVNYALRNAVKKARQVRVMYETNEISYVELLSIFKDEVDHGHPWDIKLPELWHNTIGTVFPGINTNIYYRGMLMTPESLGNYTYGYLGAAYGIPINLLLCGSYYAADFPTDWGDLENEFNDWYYIGIGFEAYYKDVLWGRI